MENSKEHIASAFAAAHGDGEAPQDTIALMIDIQQGTLRYMEREDAQAYLAHMKGVLDDLRARNIPIVWVAIGSNPNNFCPPDHENREKRESRELDAMEFFYDNLPEEEARNLDIYKEFMETHGPRKNEAMFSKIGFSALSDEEDGLRRYLGQQKGLSKIILSGGMATFCIAHTAYSATKFGYETIIATNNIIGWYGNERADNFNYDMAVWQGEDHIGKIKSKLRNYSDGLVFLNFDEAIGKKQEQLPRVTEPKMVFSAREII